MTVVVVSEFTAGGTLIMGLNRRFASFLGGALAFGADRFAARIIYQHIPLRFGQIAGDIVLGLSVFIINI
ncbi:hypothetical protein SLE2022_080750 [Rubroshorea leprosula]